MRICERTDNGETPGERWLQTTKEVTHIVGCIFNKGVSAWFSLEHARFVEEVVELGDLSKLGKDLEQRIPGGCQMGGCTTEEIHTRRPMDVNCRRRACP